MTAPALPTREVPAGVTAEQAAIVASQAAYEAQQQLLRQQLAAVVIALWAGVAQAGVFSTTEAARWVDRILPISLGAQRAMTAITVAQLHQIHRPPTPITVSPAHTTGAILRRRNPREVYQRPFTEMRWQLSKGKTVGEALASGLRRAQSITQTDVQLAHTHTARRYLQDSTKQRPGPHGTITAYRRVLSSNPNHCALCILASTMVYTRGNLMPIHPGCGCRVVPIYEGEDPGELLNERWVGDVHDIVERDLGEKYVDPGGRLGDAHYRDIIITRRHGELGPVLGVREHDFTGPGDIPNLSRYQRVNPLPEGGAEDAVDLDEL